MTINNRGLSGQPILPYVDYRSYQGADIFIDLTFLDHTGNLVNPTSVSYRIDDLTNAVPMLASTAISSVITSGTGSIGFNGTGSVANAILTVATVTSGIINVGDLILLTGLPAGTSILQQVSGTAGGVGTYRINYGVVNSISTTTFTTTSNILYVTAVAYGAFQVGDQVSNRDFTGSIQTILQNPVGLTGSLYQLQGTPSLGPFAGEIVVSQSIPTSYTLQIPGSVLQMTHNWQGSQICQIWITTTWIDPVTNKSCTAQGVSVLELCAVQTPNGAL